MKDLGTLGGKKSEACAINESGQIVGWADVKPGTDHAFLYSDGKMKDLGSFGGESQATAINGHGDVVGFSYLVGTMHAFLYRDGKMTDLDVPDGKNSRANAINDDGAIVGRSTFQIGKNWEQHAAIFMGGKVNDLNTLVSNVEQTHLSDSVMNEAIGINSKGQIIANDTFGRAYLLTPN